MSTLEAESIIAARCERIVAQAWNGEFQFRCHNQTRRVITHPDGTRLHDCGRH